MKDAKQRKAFLLAQAERGIPFTDAMRMLHGGKQQPNGFKVGGIDTSHFEPFDDEPQQYDRPMQPVQTMTPDIGGAISRGMRRAMGREPAPAPSPPPAPKNPELRRQGPTANDFFRASQLPLSPFGFLDPIAGAVRRMLPENNYLQRLPAPVYQGNDHEQFMDRRRAPVFRGDPTQLLQKLADGGDVSRAKRAMSKHWEKQNRYARGGTVHRKGMFKRGMREG